MFVSGFAVALRHETSVLVSNLNKILSVFLALLILMQSFSKVWVVFSFKVNQDYIAKVLCVNRNKPEMHCNGKCVLMQRMKASEDKERQQLPQKMKELQEVFYCYEAVTDLLLAPETITNVIEKQLIIYQNPFTTSHVQRIFRPPASSDLTV